ncbi:MAG: signal recognition particle-docking protein FtsY [Acidimicrobiaceae bacterium]|nr:signal recognition particle-docking protein FtsY [Acidimicrobiaceae bacterium]
MVNFSRQLTNTRKKFALFGKASHSRGIDDSIWIEIEETLIAADVGVSVSLNIVEKLKLESKSNGAKSLLELTGILKEQLVETLSGYDRTLVNDGNPSVWLFVGTNGVGKTTSIGKLANSIHKDGHSVVLAAGDTFRAGATEQLGLWAKRAGSQIVKGAEGADPSSVIFDATEFANARGIPLVIADTAGRLHTKKNLMEELSKIQQVAGKGPGSVQEILLVIDSTTGQNGLTQAAQFAEAVDVTGVVLTKLDGSARGGIIFAIQDQLGIPVKLVGIGENLDDLVPFDAEAFVDALFETKA